MAAKIGNKNRRKDLMGQRFGRLTVTSLHGRRPGNTSLFWNCTCSCGNKTTVSSTALRNKGTRSCGCLVKEAGRRNKSHGHCTNKKRSGTYRSWEAMLSRCHRETDPSYYNYGGRGILVCDEWRESFSNFLKDMGERPKGYSIDRIDNDLGYNPSNCRWSTISDQGKHKRTIVYLEHDGRRLSISDWARRIPDMTYSTLNQRIRKGWSIHHALKVPRLQGEVLGRYLSLVKQPSCCPTGAAKDELLSQVRDMLLLEYTE